MYDWTTRVDLKKLGVPDNVVQDLHNTHRSFIIGDPFRWVRMRIDNMINGAYK